MRSRQMSLARIEVNVRDGERVARLSGRWTLATTSTRADALDAELRRAAAEKCAWDCLEVEALDSAGAMLLWRAWQRVLPWSVPLPCSAP